ncbi:30S ribosomal protein S3 [Patescibacteria group bacterium]|nr:30S ribosomal protein S3 [Patescibacteria group bacterium]MBU2219486.1 30S ribosomal protein S3 [Patescibacteria group bacterium]MBU2263120.1 30S ribosomal protein S3 [Patescibacteria group bacterium]
MSKTVHPYSFRIGIIYGWKSRWFNLKKYKNYLKADVLLREWLEKRLRGMFVQSIEIERTPALLLIIIKTARPGLLIGRKGEGSEKLKQEILKKLNGIGAEIPQEIRLNIEEVRAPETHAKIVSQMVAESLEKRMPFRRVIKQTLEKVMANREVKGVKISLAGRLGGAEMSRYEWAKKGRIPLQTLRSDIDFARERAHLPYGDLGIKVWIYKGEKF